MTKRILSILLVVTMMFSLATVVNADVLQTITLGTAEIDATGLNAGDTLPVPVTTTAFAADVIYAGQLDVTFDKNVLKIASITNGFKGEDEYGDPVTIRWYDTAAINNANTTGKIAFKFLDTDYGLGKKYTSSMSGTLFTINFQVLADSANTTISLDTAKFSDYSTGSEVKYEVANGTVAVSGASTVKFVEDKPAVSVAWTTDTESVVGAMRFLFDAVATNGTITTSGIKYFATNDKDSTVKGEVAGTASTFYGDITEVPEDATGTYYAAAYVVIGGQEYWSNVIPCVPTVGGAN